MLLGDGEGDGADDVVPVGDGDGVAVVGLGVGDVVVELGLDVGDVLGDSVGEPAGESVGLEDSVGLAESDGVAESVGSGVCDPGPGDGDVDPPGLGETSSEGLGSISGAWARIRRISSLKASSRALMSEIEYVWIEPANWIRRPQTAASASSCSSPGASWTESTSWLAMAAVMQA